jgi:hypothetical protein
MDSCFYLLLAAETFHLNHDHNHYRPYYYPITIISFNEIRAILDISRVAFLPWLIYNLFFFFLSTYQKQSIQ